MDNSRQVFRVLLADDQHIVRVGLRAMLSLFPQIELVGDVSSTTEVVQEAKRLRPDVVLLDVRMPDGSAFEACRQILASGPGTHVIFLTSFSEEEAIFEAISAGADGFLLKDVTPEELVNAIAQVTAGRSILAPSVTHRIMDRIKAGKETPHVVGMDVLSVQEQRVLALVAQGKTNKEIGEAMGLSPKTVKNYLSNLMDKLALTRRSQAAAFYAQNVHKKTDKALYN